MTAYGIHASHRQIPPSALLAADQQEFIDVFGAGVLPEVAR